MESRYHVLRSFEPAEALIARLEEGFIEVKQRVGLVFAYAATDSAEYLQIHVFPDYKEEQAAIRLFIDPPISTAYLLVEDPDPKRCGEIAEILGRYVEFVPREELLDRARQTMESTALIRMAISAGGSIDQPTLALLLAGLHHGDEQVRAAAARGAQMVLWPELLPALQAQLDVESSDTARRELVEAIEAIEDYQGS